MPDAPSGRVQSLDLIRGVAVLGILAINIAGFAGPTASVLTPDYPLPAGDADKIAFAVNFVLFEGKMRALFCILFGASLTLFIERMDASGCHGDLLQVRRLGWLAVFGLLHFYLFWWGDILFTYALCGVIVLFMRELSRKTLLLTALVIFAGWHLTGMAMSVPDILAEEHVRTGTASATEQAQQARYVQLVEDKAEREMAEYRSGFPDQALAKLSDRPFHPLTATFDGLGETLPYMLIGMVLFGSGFFGGSWPTSRVRALAMGATLAGLVLTLGLLAWAWPRGFPIRAMTAILIYWTALPHLLMALGYAALLVLVAPRFHTTRLGARISASGRMAFSNYLGTTIVMTAIFYGWGLGLIGMYGHAAQGLFILLGWALMLIWSKPWLARYRRGPLEWVWRSLTERRMLENRR
ncbi:MAG: DUF418 domain-containing protein [Novosphingobium sp.]|nr:DUF418 domain-containing protein [Novosphingobium sp.]